jgi:hypothetical protein
MLSICSAIDTESGDFFRLWRASSTARFTLVAGSGNHCVEAGGNHRRDVLRRGHVGIAIDHQRHTLAGKPREHLNATVGTPEDIAGNSGAIAVLAEVAKEVNKAAGIHGATP